MRVVKIGLIGCGMVTLKAHIPALMNDPTQKISAHLFQITAFCGLDQETLTHINALLPQAALYTDYQTLLKHADCEAVLIATGEQDHPQLCAEALSAGKYVLCEKPLAVSADAILGLLTNLREMQMNKLQVAFNKRFHPVYLRYKELTINGSISKPIFGVFYFLTQQGKKKGWDGLLSNMIHYCDLITSIFGEISEVQSTSKETATGINVSVSMKAKSEAIISYAFSSSASWQAAVHEEWQIVDNNKTRLLSRNANESYLFRPGNETISYAESNSVFWLPDTWGYKTQLTAFYELICGVIEKPVVGLEDAYAAHCLFDKIKAQNEVVSDG